MPRLSIFMERMTDMQTMYPDFSALTVKELLAITLRESCSSEAVDELCQHFNLRDLTEAAATEISAIKGIDKKKASSAAEAVAGFLDEVFY
jgi:DNA repair protein RadC